jgi:hypothetical protein
LPHSARSPDELVEQSRWAWSGRSLR